MCGLCISAYAFRLPQVRNDVADVTPLLKDKLEFYKSTGIKLPKILADVPFISQRPNFPNGCEAVSTVMALNYMGVKITPAEFVRSYLEMGNPLYVSKGEYYACDPREKFPGDPRSKSGWGCYPEVIKKAVDKMENGTVAAYVLKDVPLSSLCSRYIDNGIPVIFWGTIDMQSPKTHLTWKIEGTDRTHTWISPFHCLLLIGYSEEGYFFNDPWRSRMTFYDRQSVETAYSGIGMEAAVILKVGTDRETGTGEQELGTGEG